MKSLIVILFFALAVASCGAGQPSSNTGGDTDTVSKGDTDYKYQEPQRGFDYPVVINCDQTTEELVEAAPFTCLFPTYDECLTHWVENVERYMGECSPDAKLFRLFGADPDTLEHPTMGRITQMMQDEGCRPADSWELVEFVTQYQDLKIPGFGNLYIIFVSIRYPFVSSTGSMSCPYITIEDDPSDKEVISHITDCTNSVSCASSYLSHCVGICE